MIGDRKRITLLAVAPQKLAYVIGAPEVVETLTAAQRCAFGARPRTAAALLHQAMAIEHGMDGAFGGKFDIGEATHQPLADLPSTPARVLMLLWSNCSSPKLLF